MYTLTKDQFIGTLGMPRKDYYFLSALNPLLEEEENGEEPAEEPEEDDFSGASEESDLAPNR